MMQQHTFSRFNTLAAWLVFAIAAVVYGLTVEPTASLWDCPEFIACGHKLEIGHQPGAPVFMLVSNLFSQLANGPSQVALMVNLLSALLSAGCIFFLFLTITHLARRLVAPGDGALTLAQVATVEGCGLVGALAYTFSDTFWFSAVEAEVYAFSSFLTALMFWLILRWEREADTPRGDRWLVLTAYVTGLSIGVHLLCLLCLPAMSLWAYYRKASRPTRWGVVKALSAGALLVGLILYGLIPGVTWVGGWFELLFTNVLGCPYHTGLAFYLVLIAVALLVAHRRARSRTHRVALSCLAMLLVGYSSYGVILIRAQARPPMCENAPDNLFALGSYLGREQYGDVPLVYGPAYTSEVDYEVKGDYLQPRERQGAAVRRPSIDPGVQRYEVVRHKTEYLYKQNMWFPRMHSQRHAQAYEDWMGGVEKRDGLPTAMENLRFFLSYQVGFMYGRYFLWNFVGRQNNIQGHGEAEHGNWLTGIAPIDDLLLGCDTSKMPSDLRHNAGRNVYYALPLLLGLMGAAWQLRRGREGRQQFWTVALLFFMTGLAIVVYLNQTPQQPRERDYAYAGSFYAFAVWIGLATAGLASLVGRLLRGRKTLAALVAVGLTLMVPLQMASQAWDDHDRSGRTACRDFGSNYLESTQREGHPILLTNGDNDTFPLWYNQEVEGVRTDVRDCNLQYLQTDWYIDQLRRPAYLSSALPITWQRKDYREGTNEVVAVRPELRAQVEQLCQEHPEEARELFGAQPFDLRNVLDHWVLGDRPEMHCIPTDSLTLSTPQGTMAISLKGHRALYKSDLMVLEMLSHADAGRPIYTSISLGPDELSYLRDHLVLEGVAYRVSPSATADRVDVERLYDNVMHRFRYGSLWRPGIYVDEDVKRMANTLQLVMAVLIDSLLEQGDTTRALAVCRKWQRELPPENVPYTDAALTMARCFYVSGLPSEGDLIVESLLRRSAEWLDWIDTFSPRSRRGVGQSASLWRQTLQKSLALAAQADRNHLLKSYLR